MQPSDRIGEQGRCGVGMRSDAAREKGESLHELYIRELSGPSYPVEFWMTCEGTQTPFSFLLGSRS